MKQGMEGKVKSEKYSFALLGMTVKSQKCGIVARGQVKIAIIQNEIFELLKNESLRYPAGADGGNFGYG